MEYTNPERSILKSYFTNTTSNVFALKNLSEVTKGALFARYSRTDKDLRRLFLDEFCEWLPNGQVEVLEVGRASDLYERAFNQFGDDSIAQLGGAHIAIENVSLLAAKKLQRSRLAAYLESSTRYRPFSGVSDYVETPDNLKRMVANAEKLTKALDNEGYEDPLDTSRFLLPLGTLTNMGIYASGLSFERMIMRHWNDNLEEVRDIIRSMQTELTKVIPDFMKRTKKNHPHGESWKNYYKTRNYRMLMESFKYADWNSESPRDPRDVGMDIRLVETPVPTYERIKRLQARMLFPHTYSSEEELCDRIEEHPFDVKQYLGIRRNRRHLSGRALEDLTFRFEIVGDYATFRDIQRHRMMTIENQEPTNRLGYFYPSIESNNELIYEGGIREGNTYYMDSLAKMSSDDYPPYYLPQAVNIRYAITANLRQLLYMIELRSMPQGHPNYRELVETMKTKLDLTGWMTAAGITGKVMARENY